MNEFIAEEAATPSISHESLSKQLTTLEKTVRASPELSSLKLSVQLATLRGHLIEHYSFEEQSGWKAAVLKQDPQLEHAVGQLIDEHRQLLESLNTLIDESSALAGLDASFCEKVLRFIRRVRDHEAHEDDVLEDAFAEDLGAGD